VKARWQFLIRAVLLTLVIVVIAVVFIAVFRQRGRSAVTIVGLHKSSDSGRMSLEVRNDTPGRVRLFAVELWVPAGTNWRQVSQVLLGDTNSTEKSIRLEVDPPAGQRKWKARLVYMPAFSGMKLLPLRTEHGWKTKSKRKALTVTGWAGARYAYSEVFSE
jgi:hypothetical protein